MAGRVRYNPRRARARHTTTMADRSVHYEAAFEAYLRGIWTQGYGCAKDEEGRYRDGNAQSLWECWRAALSADGGEDKRDAEYWRFLREQHEGTESFEDAEGFTVTEPTARAFTVFKPGQGDYHLEPVGCMPGELEETIRAAIAANQAKE